MVVLMEEFGGLSLKRKGADEPELFDDGRSGVPISCRATKMRRLACPDAGKDQRCCTTTTQDGQAAVGELPMGDVAPAPSAAAATEEEKTMVLYGGGGGAPSDAEQGAPRLRPCGAFARAGADWVVRAMLREADSRTVRELLAGAQGEDLALAVVPWVPPPPSEEEAEPSVAEDADSDGAAAMDVEPQDEGPVRHWAGETAFGSAGCSEAFVYRWPQHCLAPPQVPVVEQASPVTWSW